MDTPQQKKSRTLIPILSVVLIIVTIVAGWLGHKLKESQETVNLLTSQLENAQKQIAELQPLAEKARTLPVRLTIDRHALNAGYNVLAFNLSRSSLRFRFTVNGTRKFGAVIDGGRFFIVRGLASGDTLAVDSEGYDTKTIKIE